MSKVKIIFRSMSIVFIFLIVNNISFAKTKNEDELKKYERYLNEQEKKAIEGLKKKLEEIEKGKKRKVKYKKIKFYKYIVKYPIGWFLDYFPEEWNIYIYHKNKVLFKLEAPEGIMGVKLVNIDGEGKKELVIYGFLGATGVH